ncbi:MAG: TAT-variant-translocated molybdopterin oxidoreductase [Verrucomicrobiota bacterium]
MKRKWHHPKAERIESTVDRKYWRGFDELEDTPEFRDWLEKEFPRGAAEVSGPEADETTRRNFMKYMGASASLAGLGLSSCRRPDQYLIAYNEHVEHIIPGKALLYSSAMPTPDGCIPLVVTTHEGRPTKVDGNRLHPESTGGCGTFAQASVLDLYDPDRSKTYRKDGEPTTVEVFEEELLNGIRASKGEKVGVLLGSSTSPTLGRVLQKVKAKYPQIQFFEYEPLGSGSKQEAEERLYGEGVSAVPRFDLADKIFSLDCDFIGLDRQGENPAAQWAKRRDPDGNMARLYMVESAFTITGGVADHRLRIPASQILKVGALLAKAVADATGDAALKAASSSLLSEFQTEIFDQEWITEAAKDLVASKGKSLVVSGSRQPLALQLLAGMMNSALGAVGGGRVPLQLFKHGRKPLPGIEELAAAMDSGKVETLILTGPGDPIYDAPSDLGFAELFGKLKSSIHVGIRYNATAQAADWHVPGTHYLESWGDARSVTGILTIVQPMILPLFGGVSDLEFLLSLTQEAPSEEEEEGEAVEKEDPAYEAVRETFASMAKGDVDKAWNLTLRDGFLDGVRYQRVTTMKNPGAIGAEDVVEYPGKESIEIVLSASSQVWDGRYVNNSWLQEVPDPITKLTWDNAAVMSKKTADRIGVTHDGQMISISVGGRPVEAPAFRMPGQADFTIHFPLGYGQKNPGRVGEGTGFNAYPLKTTATPYIVPGATVTRTGEKYELAPTAIHWSMQGRAIVREGTKEMYDEDHHFAVDDGMDSHIPPNISLYQGPDFFKKNSEQTAHGAPLQRTNGGFLVDEHHQWAMTIDLNTCTGCNACTIACQAENNIPVVGKREVMRGREMHWVRMDRYFSSPAEKEDDHSGMTSQKVLVNDRRGRPEHDDDQIEMLMQPVSCVQCESAPCETVCPVNATVHSGDGLNAMTYNRCIGTRYCANNCPYKARRFNYFDYNKRSVVQETEKLGIKAGDLDWGPLAEARGLGTTSIKLQKNPNVTVRMRGVIEKCTYCVQRLQAAKINQKAKARDSKDVQVPANGVNVACQDACGTGSVTFGNLLAKGDDIRKQKGTPENDFKDANPRSYDILKYIGTRPRTSYLAKVRNPNMKMPGAKHVGHATSHMH